MAKAVVIVHDNIEHYFTAMEISWVNHASGKTNRKVGHIDDQYLWQSADNI